MRRRWSMPLLPRIETESCDQAKKGHRSFRFSLLTAYVLYCTSPVTRVGAAQWGEPARALGGSGGAGRSGNALALVGVGLPPATVGSRAGGLDRHRTELRTVLFFRSRPLGPMLTRQQKTARSCVRNSAPAFACGHLLSSSRLTCIRSRLTGSTRRHAQQTTHDLTREQRRQGRKAKPRRE